MSTKILLTQRKNSGWKFNHFNWILNLWWLWNQSNSAKTTTELNETDKNSYQQTQTGWSSNADDQCKLQNFALVVFSGQTGW